MECARTPIEIRNKTEFGAIDVAKLVCAFLVVAIHTGVFGSSSNPFAFWGNYLLMECIARLAVPFFFICSGFFLFRKMPEKIDFKIVWAYAKRMILLFLLWSLLEFPITYPASYFENDNGFFLNLGMYLYALIIRGEFHQLWYFVSVAVACLFIAAWLKVSKYRFGGLIAFSVLLFALSMFDQGYHGVLAMLEKEPFFAWLHTFFRTYVGTSRNGILEGIPFVTLGAYAAIKPVRLTQKNALLLSIASFVLLIAEFLILTQLGSFHNHDLLIFTAPLTFFSFLFLASLPIRKDQAPFQRCRAISTTIFLVHLFVYALSIGIFRDLLQMPPEVPLVQYAFVCLVSTLISYLVMKLKKQKAFSWLRHVI